MPCTTISLSEQQQRERERIVERLRAGIISGAVRVVIDRRTGSVAFQGWDQAGSIPMADLCAFRRLSAEGFAPLRIAVAKAEALAGRKFNPQAVAAGVHSHDGGGTWSTH